MAESEVLEGWRIEERHGLYIAENRHEAWVTVTKGKADDVFFNGAARLPSAVLRRLQALAVPAAVEQALSVPEPAASEREGKADRLDLDGIGELAYGLSLIERGDPFRVDYDHMGDLLYFSRRFLEQQAAEAGKAQAEGFDLRAELQKHQDLVEALQWLPAGTVVDFCDLDDFLEELRRDGWRPQRECSHVFRDSNNCANCGIDMLTRRQSAKSDTRG